jgi:type IV fimbrial biogenesis protein FimT
MGITLIELLVVLAISGIVLSVGIVQIDSRGAATRQAAQVLSASVNKARFEAVRSNRTSAIVFVADDGTESGMLRICGNIDDTNLTCPASAAIHEVRFSGGDLARARIASPTELAVYFDRRGIVRNPGTQAVVTITDRGGGNVRTVTILPTGRAEVQ